MLVRFEEVLVCNAELVDDLGGDLLLDLDLGYDPAERVHRCLFCEQRDIRADETVRGAGVVVEVHVLGKRHAARVDLEDLLSSLGVRDADLDLAVEPAAAPEGGVDHIREVRCGDHHHLATGLQPVHQGKELGDDPALDLALHLLAFRRDRVDLVDEDDRRRVLLRLLKDLPQALFGLTVILAHDLGTRERDEVGVHLVCHRFCDQRLPRPRRAVEQDAFRRLDTETLEEFGVPERELDHLPDKLQFPVKAADVLVVDVGRRLAPSLLGLVWGLLELDLGAFCDDGDAFRGHLRDDERERVPEDADPDVLPFRDRSAAEESSQILLAAHEADGLGRLDGHFLCVSGLGLPDPDFVVDPGSDVAPGAAVDAQDRLAGVLRESRPYERRCLLAPLNLDDVAADKAERLHGVDAQSGDPPAGVFMSRLLDGHLNGFGVSHVNNLLLLGLP